MNQNTKTWLTVGGVGVGLTALALVGRKLYKRHQLNKEVKAYNKENYDSTGRKLKPGQKVPSGDGVQKVNLVEVADSIARNLGVIYAPYDPRSWSENDTDVYNILKALPPPLAPRLVDVYKDKYKRNLRSDLERMLDEKYYQEIKGLFY